MARKRQQPVTALNEYDRKILGRYTGFYTNFIESNTADTEILHKERRKEKS